LEIKLDEIDRKIVGLLTENARMSYKEIAGRVFLSSTAVSARVENLEKSGVISGYHAEINPLALGFYTKAFINVEIEPVQKKEFYPYIAGVPSVVECNCVTGEYSMLIEVIFRTPPELDAFIGELQRFGKTKTLIVFSTSVEHRNMFFTQTGDGGAALRRMNNE
jgi:Lrp/AsnC family leucine-responsive transcriptional regulator